MTKKRLFVLYAPSIDERNLWVHTFCWIILNNYFVYIQRQGLNAILSNKDALSEKNRQEK
jgi:hypothetical protein